MRSVLSLVFTASIAAINATKYPDITPYDVHLLRTDIRNAIDESTTYPQTGPIPINVQPLLSSIVRLVFHDCAGKNIKQDSSDSSDSSSSSSSSSSESSSDSDENDIELTLNRCNGCIDFDFIDNAGIEEAAFWPLEDVYYDDLNEWYTKMSRADFWAAAGTIALEYGAANQWEPSPLPIQFGIPAPLPDIPYYFGRKDCANSPEAQLPSNVAGLFPDPHAGWKDTFAWFNDNFGFNERETVTIIGAHTLGQARTTASGFLGAWAGTPNVLDIEFYINIAAKIPAFLPQTVIGIFATSYVQKPVEDTVLCNGQCTSDRTQWVVNNPAIFGPVGIDGLGLNFNSDMALAIKIEDHLDIVTGVVTCTAPQFVEFVGNFTLPTRCPRQAGIADIVEEFAGDNPKWLNEFAQVWERMITVNENLNKLDKLTVPYDRSGETPAPVPAGPPGIPPFIPPF